jgi:hypothetical protein
VTNQMILPTDCESLMMTASDCSAEGIYLFLSGPCAHCVDLDLICMMSARARL